MILKGVRKSLLVGIWAYFNRKHPTIPNKFWGFGDVGQTRCTEHHRRGANAATEVLMFKSKHSVLDGNGKSESHLAS
jgi:hypothetical protein